MPDHRQTLKRFGHYSKEVAYLLKEGLHLTQEEQTYLENHLLIVQLALAMSRYHPGSKASSRDKYETSARGR